MTGASTDIPMNITPESFGPEDDLPIGGVLRRFTEQGLGASAEDDAPLSRNQLGLVQAMRNRSFRSVPFRLSSHEPVYRSTRRGMHLDVGARYLPLGVDTNFGKYEAFESQDLIPMGGWRYSLNADLLRLWVEEEIEQELGVSPAWDRKKSKKRTAAKAPVRSQIATKLPAAVRQALKPQRNQLKKAVLQAARGDTSKLAEMLHGRDVAQVMSRIQQARKQQQQQTSPLVSQADTPIGVAGAAALAAQSPTMTSLSSEVLSHLIDTHPSLAIDASKPEMSIAGAAQQVIEKAQTQARRQAKRQLLGIASTRTALAPNEVHQVPGLLAASAEQRAVRTSLSMARMFSPSATETQQTAAVALAGTPLDRFLGRPPLGTALPSFTDRIAGGDEKAITPHQRSASSIITALQATSGQALAISGRADAAADTMPSAVGGRQPSVGRAADSTVDFGGTALRALKVAEEMTSARKGNASLALAWMRQGGRGALLEGLVGGGKREDVAATAAAEARVRPTSTANASPTAHASSAATLASAQSYPAAMGAGIRVAAALVSPTPTVSMAQATAPASIAAASARLESFAASAAPSASQVARSLGLPNAGQQVRMVPGATAPMVNLQPSSEQAIDGPQTTDSPVGLSGTPVAQTASTPLQPASRLQPAAYMGLYDEVIASGSAPALYSSYDATSDGDFADILAQAMVSRPALRKAMALGQIGGVAQAAEGFAGKTVQMVRTAEGHLVGVDPQTGAVVPGAVVSEQADFGTAISSGRPFLPGAAEAALVTSSTLAPTPSATPETGSLTSASQPSVQASAGTPAWTSSIGARRTAQVQLQDILVSPRYLTALTHSIDQVQRSLSLLGRLNPMSLRSSAAAAASAGIRADSSARMAMSLASPATLPQLATIANELASEIVTGVASGRDWTIGSWITESRLKRDWRVAAVANQIAEVIRGNYNVEADSAQKARRAQHAMTSWGPSTVFVQPPPPKATEPDPKSTSWLQRANAEASAKRAIAQAVQKALTSRPAPTATNVRRPQFADINVASLRQLVQPTSARTSPTLIDTPNEVEAQFFTDRQREMVRSIETRIRQEETATRKLRLFSPEKTLAMLAPQLESGGILDPVGRSELSEALQALATRSVPSSSPQRVRTSFGTLTLQMRNGQLVVDAEEISSSSPSTSMSTQGRSEQIAPLTAPTYQLQQLAAVSSGRAMDSSAAQPEQVAAMPGNIGQQAAAMASNLASSQPSRPQQAAFRSPVQVALGLPSRAERSAGVQLDPPTVKRLTRALTSSGQLANLPQEERAALIAAAAGVERRQPIALLSGSSLADRIEVFAGSGQTARLAQAVARAITSSPSPTLGRLLAELPSLSGLSNSDAIIREVASIANLSSTPINPQAVMAAARSINGGSAKLGEALEALSSREDLMTVGLPALAGATQVAVTAGSDSRWDTRSSVQTEALTRVLEEAATRRSGGALGSVGMGRRAGGALANMSRADLAYVLPYMQRSTGDLNQLATRAHQRFVGRRAPSQQTAPVQTQAIEQAVAQEAAQTRAVITRASQTIERALPALQSLSGTQLVELGLTLGRGGSLLQAARTMGLANNVITAIADLEVLPQASASISQAVAGPSGFATALKSLPALVVQAASQGAVAEPQVDPTVAAINSRLREMGERSMRDLAPERFSELTVLDPTLGALSERMAQTGISAESAALLRAPVDAYVSKSRQAKARARHAKRMLPVIDRVLTALGEKSIGTLSKSPGRSTNRIAAIQAALGTRGLGRGMLAMMPQALSGTMLRRFKDVEGVLAAFGDESASDSRSRNASLLRARASMAMGGLPAGLPGELIAPLMLRRSAAASAGSGSAFAGGVSASASAGEMAMADSVAGAANDVAVGRAGMVGLWLPEGVERLVGADVDVLMGSSGGFGGAFVTPQMFSGRLMTTGGTGTGRTAADRVSQAANVQVRGDALNRTAHRMALGLQNLSMPNITPPSGATGVADLGLTLGVGSGSGALGWSPWMTTTNAQEGTHKLMALLGMGDLASHEMPRSSGALPQQKINTPTGVPLVMPQPSTAPSMQPDGPSGHSGSLGGLSRTLLQRTVIRESSAVASGHYQGADLTTSRELYSPHQTLPQGGTGKPHAVARASNTEGGGDGGSAPEDGGKAGGGGQESSGNINIEDTARKVLIELQRRWALELERRGSNY